MLFADKHLIWKKVFSSSYCSWNLESAPESRWNPDPDLLILNWGKYSRRLLISRLLINWCQTRNFKDIWIDFCNFLTPVLLSGTAPAAWEEPCWQTSQSKGRFEFVSQHRYHSRSEPASSINVQNTTELSEVEGLGRKPLIPTHRSKRWTLLSTCIGGDSSFTFGKKIK